MRRERLKITGILVVSDGSPERAAGMTSLFRPACPPCRSGSGTPHSPGSQAEPEVYGKVPAPRAKPQPGRRTRRHSAPPAKTTADSTIVTMPRKTSNMAAIELGESSDDE